MKSINIKNVISYRSDTNRNGDKVTFGTSFKVIGKDIEIFSNESKASVDKKVFQAECRGSSFIEVED